MRPQTALTILFAACVFASCNNNGKNYINGNYGGNRAPLQQEAFIELPLGSITPKGWLLDMLETQRDGATGRLDELYPSVMGPRNGWLGGDGDQWERGPYWIDGLVPLAYILKDEKLIEKARPWIEWTLASQQEDGYFGPLKDYGPEPGLQRDNCRDWWPKMVMLKVLMQHYSATKDERVIPFMTKYFHYQLANLDKFPLDNWSFWARYRGGDNLMAVYWLYNKTGDKKLLELGDKIYSQTQPFTEMFLERDQLTRVGTIHTVNLAQGIKTPVVYWQADPQEKYLTALDYALEDLQKYHGYPIGIFSGDEAIHGNDPTQGIELCSIVEYMFSLETMYKITGDPKFAETLEKVAYNALPTQTDDEYMTRQYFQQVNQIRLNAQTRNFDVNHDGYGCCFGILAGYPCCTSNMHQGWPKFTQNLWYATADKGVAVTQYAASEVQMLVADGVNITIEESTNYPFEEDIEFTIKEMDRPALFSFRFRIPSWSTKETILVNGKTVECIEDGKSMVTIEREWKEEDRISVAFTPEIRLTKWKENARSVERGPLVYALKMKADWKKVKNTGNAVYQGDWYYEITSKSPWNYALIQCPDSQLDTHYAVEVNRNKAGGPKPWSEEGAPVTITTQAAEVPFWKEYNGMTGPLPYSIMAGFPVGETETIELIPYGCTTLRITEFPMSGQHSAE